MIYGYHLFAAAPPRSGASLEGGLQFDQHVAVDAAVGAHARASDRIAWTPRIANSPYSTSTSIESEQLLVVSDSSGTESTHAP